MTRSQKAGAKWEQKYQEMLGMKKFDPRLSIQPQPRNKENLEIVREECVASKAPSSTGMRGQCQAGWEVSYHSHSLCSGW